MQMAEIDNILSRLNDLASVLGQVAKDTRTLVDRAMRTETKLTQMMVNDKIPVRQNVPGYIVVPMQITNSNFGVYQINPDGSIGQYLVGDNTEAMAWDWAKQYAEREHK
jgi:ABC-type transporter Mla subunit MlaD